VKRVAMVGPELAPIPPIRGGATENWIENVCRRVGRYRCMVLGPADPELPMREIRNNVEYIRIPARRVRRMMAEWLRRPDFSYAKRVFRYLVDLKPHLVHVQNRPLISAYLRSHLPLKVPVILQMHNLYDYLGKYERPPVPTSGSADVFLAVSQFVREQEARRLGLGIPRSGVLHNGVDTDKFRPGAEEEEASRLRRRYGLVGKRLVLYTGKLRASKGVDVLLEAMQRIFEQDVHQEVGLLLVGGPHFGLGRVDRRTDFFRNLMKKVESFQDRVTITGFVSPERMAPYYSLGSVYAAPSQLEEGFPSVLLEAMSSGLPVVSTRLGGIPELVQHGRTGLLVEKQDDPGELAQVIQHLLESPEECLRLGKEARAQVVQRYSWDVVARDMECFYAELLG